MSLRAFHVVFVTASTLVAFFFAAWCLGLGGHEPSLGWRVAGAGAVVAGVGLGTYGAWFLRKSWGLL